jgi:hypothetical protein
MFGRPGRLGERVKYILKDASIITVAFQVALREVGKTSQMTYSVYCLFSPLQNMLIYMTKEHLIDRWD